MKFEDKIEIIGLKGIPLIKKGDDIPKIIVDALERNSLTLQNGDIIIIAQTIISKCNGRTKNLRKIIPTENAMELYKAIKQ